MSFLLEAATSRVLVTSIRATECWQQSLKLTSVRVTSKRRARDVRFFQTSTSRQAPSVGRLQAQETHPTIDRSASKVFKDADEAVKDIKDGSTILSAGFGLCGVAGTRLSVK